MPFVHIVMEPRDEESKHRIAREVADAVAEGTNNSIDGIQTIFHEVARPGYARGLSLASRRPRRTDGPIRAEHVAISRLRIGEEAAYLAFRRDHNNPALARQPGFVSTMLLRLDSGRHEYLLVNKWMTKADAETWSASAEHKRLVADAAKTAGVEFVSREAATLLHQTFGRLGGQVMEVSDRDKEREHPALKGSRA